MNNKTKQVIVMRKSFVFDSKKITPRKGKYITQGAHASLKAILDYTHNTSENKYIIDYNDNPVLKDWFEGLYTKVCCVVETEEELLSVYTKAKEMGLFCSLITDAGLTEFNGVPTITCCAIGPAWSEEVDKITGNLELF